MQSNKEKYWFAYRTSYLDKMNSCKNSYIAFVCGDENNIIIMPIDYMESNKHKLNYTEKNGSIHWHIVIFKNEDGTFTWLHSIPKVNEIDISNYLI